MALGRTSQKSFEDVKKLLFSDRCLAFFDVSKPIAIQVDASNSGLRAVLLQEGKPVSYASRSVTSTEKNYAIIEKELLAVLFGCERFHQYIYGNKTLVESDHKPLESIIKKPLARVPARLQRMLLRLQRYDFQSSYKSGNKMLLADALSRASMKDADLEVSDEELAAQIHMVYSNNEVTGTNLEEVRRATANDHVLAELGEKVENG